MPYAAAMEAERDRDHLADPFASKMAADTTTNQVRYVSQAALESLQEKFRKGLEIHREDVSRLIYPERLGDEDMVVPVQLGSEYEDLPETLRKHGARGVAAAFVAARTRCEGNGGEALTAKEWRNMIWEADGTFKPLLLAYIVLTAMAGVLLAATRDASRPFCLVALLHLNPEPFLWSYLLLGPGLEGSDQRWLVRLAVRALYLAGDIVLLLGPTRADGLVSPVLLATYLAMAGISDAVCFWLGLFYYLYRLDSSIRRLGVGLLVHGFAFQIAACSYLNRSLFTADGTTGLHNWGWFLHCIMTFLALAIMVPIFNGKFNIRAQQPSVRSVCIMLACCLGNFIILFALAGEDQPKALMAGELEFLGIHKKPSFLPRGGLLVAYKVVTTIGGAGLALHALSEFNLARQRPLAPTLAAFVGSSIWSRLRWASESRASNVEATQTQTRSETAAAMTSGKV